MSTAYSPSELLARCGIRNAAEFMARMVARGCCTLARPMTDLEIKRAKDNIRYARWKAKHPGRRKAK